MFAEYRRYALISICVLFNINLMLTELKSVTRKNNENDDVLASDRRHPRDYRSIVVDSSSNSSLNATESPDFKIGTTDSPSFTPHTNINPDPTPRASLPYNLMEESHGVDWPSTEQLLANCSVEYANANLLQQDHPCVIDIIRRLYLHGPAAPEVHYQLDRPNEMDPSDGRSTATLRLFRNQTGGFFVEFGALDGEFSSNTLYMERYFKWTGVLIEEAAPVFQKLRTRNRKSHSLSVCLSPEPYALTHASEATSMRKACIATQETKNVTVDEFGLVIWPDDSIISDGGKEEKEIIQCFPLYSILLAVNRTWVDFLSMDARGHELNVLSTIPWSKVKITVMSVRWNLNPETEAAITNFMIRNGFVKLGVNELYHAADIIYARRPLRKRSPLLV